MNNSEAELQVVRLEYSNNTDEYTLYRAALEWDLAHPIIIESEKDLKSEYKWRDRLTPFRHQIENLITFCRRLPVTLLADDVGLGKTISAGLIISELMVRNRVSKVLIVCPKILIGQWQDELRTKFDIPSVMKIGQELLDEDSPDWTGAVITTYNSARIYLDRLTSVGYDMLVLDEAHKLRNLYGVDRAPQVALKFKKALEERMFKYVLMLTATPIQNRLWDLYSLVDLLTVARGHTNPFGTTGLFAQKYIADNRVDARKLKTENEEEFRSVVYGYMSRVRRIDANLHFPERVVFLHNIDPTSQEIELIRVATEGIEKMNRLVQIGILQSLVSSPEALISRLEHMVDNETIEKEFVDQVKVVASRISITSKLKGLGILIDGLRNEKPQNWRVVIFTRWIETQTSIQCFLEAQGIRCGIINGGTASKNQDTIDKFKKEHPEINVIVSTEAGSEGVNLQVANVLVNYDLPWNPMIVEQRIGRVQRLGSDYEKVCIYNIVLQDTFEGYIVGRLMEKLQMASHAIGDIDSLLEAAGANGDGEGGADGFEQNILDLILASLAGKDIEEATRKKEKSIIDAKIQLEQEEKNIENMLGGMDDSSSDTGPQCPRLPTQENSMDAKSFVLKALENLGAILLPQSENTYILELDGRKDLIRLNSETTSGDVLGTLYIPGSPTFDRLVRKIVAKKLHKIEDLEVDLAMKAEMLTRNWVTSFDGVFSSADIRDVSRSFVGEALVRVRATVAHDSYERLVKLTYTPNEYFFKQGLVGLEPISRSINRVSSIGLLESDLIRKAKLDPGIIEFCRFYNERLEYELERTGGDERKNKKIEDDFTVRFEFALLGLEGFIERQLQMKVSYGAGGSERYDSELIVIPSKMGIFKLPQMAECQKTKKTVPEVCLDRCEISNLRVMRHLLIKSEFSSRLALEEYIIICSLTGKKALSDEIGVSSITGNSVNKTLLKKSILSGKQGEFEFFEKCEFTGIELLTDELASSQVSGKKYRLDEEVVSMVSGKKGHKNEFIQCSQTHQPLLISESEMCEVTRKIVMPGVLETCAISNKKVLPSELERSSISGKKALKKYFVSSNLSGVLLLEEEAIKSVAGFFCTLVESKTCLWSGRNCHPEDLRTCHLSGLTFHSEYITPEVPTCLSIMTCLLDGVNRKADKSEIWEKIKLKAVSVLDNKNLKIEASELSPSTKHLAVSLEIKTMLGLKTRYGGFIYSISDDVIVGRVSSGKRDGNEWIED